jgi:uracil-DNA glycosylase family 4
MSDADEWNWIAAQAREHLQRLATHGVARLPIADLVVADAAPAPAAAPAAAAVSGIPGIPGTPGVRDGRELQVIRDDLGNCTRCKLHPTRKNIVFGVGNPAADLVFVGEAPGANEDAQGEPFVGDAGQLLTRMIAAMGWAREDVYIANILKCRPPGNRNPEPDEIAECEPFLIRQLAALKPRVIVALGKFAAQCLLRKPDTPISALRGRFHEYQGIRVMPTYHPAYLLRTPSAKRMVWDDLQLVMAELDRLGVKPPRQPGA